MDVLQLFTIANVVQADRTQLAVAFQPVKTWNLERAAHAAHPGRVVPGNADNLDVAGPYSAYDEYA
jgi:hypothetical protein